MAIVRRRQLLDRKGTTRLFLCVYVCSLICALCSSTKTTVTALQAARVQSLTQTVKTGEGRGPIARECKNSSGQDQDGEEQQKTRVLKVQNISFGTRNRRLFGQPGTTTPMPRSPTALRTKNRLISRLGDALAVGCLALLAVNQLAVVLNIPFLLPFSLIPIALLTCQTSLSLM